MVDFFAHSGTPGNFSDWQLLRDHLQGVSEKAKRLAEVACPNDKTLAEAARAAGLLHDLGKYRPEFQLMIRGLPVQRDKTYHKQAGAAKAWQMRNAPLAFAIAGHHGGMPDAAKLQGDVKGDNGLPVVTQVWDRAIRNCPALAGSSITPPNVQGLDADLFTRVLFSCLVDADWADTGEHYRQVKKLPPEPEVPPLQAGAWLERLLVFIQGKAAECREKAPTIAAIREEILAACLIAAELSPGLFSLTVPTGGGKTLSGLAFGLKHAALHLDVNGRPRIHRLIYVAPYLSILDQNAKVIRQALGFGADSPEVLEHHSLADPPGNEEENQSEREAAARRAENWDAPLVITTSVQFYESLFSHKPGRCRKLHNIARSVIILDECQTLPPDLVAPTCSVLGQLTRRLGCTLVLCTATQPAFDHADMPERLVGVREIIPASLNLFERLRRVRVDWPGRTDVLDWSAVVARMRQETSALCIVNTRRAARELFQTLRRSNPKGLFHLSTGMCPAHRLAVLGAVKERLAEGRPCYLVSTQLIEAGVDIDFPFVMRELAPLEAIIQSAGRCNREGKRNGPAGEPGGKVLVFRSVEGTLPPDRWYKAGRSVLETSFLNNDRLPQVDNPADIRDYFERLYRTGHLDAKGIQAHREKFRFESAGQSYQLIEDDGVSVVVASWKERESEVASLLDQVRKAPSRAAYRKLAPFQVNLRRYELQKVAGSYSEEASGVQVWRGGYDPDLGLSAENTDVLLLV